MYLSPAIDCFDGMPVVWTIERSPAAKLTNKMLDSVISQLKPWKQLIIHSDRGYRWSCLIKKIKEAGLTSSMSKKGCCADNSACEGFFGHLKTEMFYGRQWENVSLEEFIKRVKSTLSGKEKRESRNHWGIWVRLNTADSKVLLVRESRKWLFLTNHRGCRHP